ncbi:Regulator of chromosome condensation RCC1 [Arabidopsis suecica]|uniref:Regulator of chromosome condensation RCC1 n=1 Tax=Arabidopsis suecica TaxID=45249 RepID=A0A8T2DQ99_ARASU|nr:Regulator of chromosome condensation RCC1 [Arabidopsis suecica]
MAALSHRLRSFTRRFSSTRTTQRSGGGANTKVPILYTSPDIDSDPVTLQLFSWGRGASGQLGGGIEEIRMYPSPVANLLFRSDQSFSLAQTPGRIDADSSSFRIGISCGLFHSGLTIDGDLWIWGKGDGGRLGFGQENSVFVPNLNPLFEEHSIRCIALGGLHSVALTHQGDVFTWGYGGFGALGHKVYTRELVPRRVDDSWDCKISAIATSGTHTAAITESGELYMWGREEGDGRLGLGPGRGPNEGGGFSVPSKVKALTVPVASVSCGGFFTMALTKEGQLWNWGANSNYELGRGDNLGGWEPMPVPSLEGVRITQIACGGYHSLALTEEGKVLSWGHGGHGQLGSSSLRNQKVPTEIEALADKKIVFIASGGSSSAAITDGGELWMWGNAKDFQLGVPGLPEIQTTPVEVNFLTEEDECQPHKVISISIGASHALCLVSRSP